MCFTGKCPYEKFLPWNQDCICLAPGNYCWMNEELEEKEIKMAELSSRKVGSSIIISAKGKDVLEIDIFEDDSYPGLHLFLNPIIGSIQKSDTEHISWTHEQLSDTMGE